MNLEENLSIMGNWHATKLIQVLKPTLEFRVYSIARHLNMGILMLCLILCPRKGWIKEVLVKMVWFLRSKAELMPPFDECPTPSHQLIMNIIVWNSRGMLKPNFQQYVREKELGS